MRLTVAVEIGRNGQQNPKIQIWRENKTDPGTYYKAGPDIPIIFTQPNEVCTDHQSERIGNIRIFTCILSDSARVSVQPGDFIGLEFPPMDDDALEIIFKAGDLRNYIFEGQVSSSVNFSEARATANDLPQITFLVNILGKSTIEICLYCVVYCLAKQVSLPCMCVIIESDVDTDEQTESCYDSTSLTTTQAENRATTVTSSSDDLNNTILLQRIALGSTTAVMVAVITVASVVVIAIWRRSKRKKTIMITTNDFHESIPYRNPVYADGRQRLSDIN